MLEHIKEVIYEGYCQKCKYVNIREQDDPCNACLTQNWNVDTHRPVNFKKKDEKVD